MENFDWAKVYGFNNVPSTADIEASFLSLSLGDNDFWGWKN